MGITYARAASLALAIALTGIVPVAAQETAAAPRANVIAASFSKFKSMSKEKRGVRKEKYIKVHSVPAIKANPAEYSGRYVFDDFGLDLVMELHVNRDGSFTGIGSEPLSDNVRRTFELRDGRIRDGLLTATKVYGNGSPESFEGAFLDRTTSLSPDDKGVTVFGLGTLISPVNVGGNTLERLFFQRGE